MTTETDDSINRLLAQIRLPEDLSQARRAFHGRGKSVPEFDWVTADYFPPVLLLILFQNTDTQWREQLAQACLEQFASVNAVVVQTRVRGDVDTEHYGEPVPEQHWAKEGDLEFALTFKGNQNVGFFPDMRLLREHIRDHAEGKKVLNLFAFTCAFSVAAVAGGASKVYNLDLNRNSLTLGRESHRRNQHDMERVEFWALNALRSWKKIKNRAPYDLIIVDPPTRQPNSFIATKDYARMVSRLVPHLAVGAEIILCLNATHLGEPFLKEVMAPHADFMELAGSILPPPEFREQEPERGLKILRYRKVAEMPQRAP